MNVMPPMLYLLEFTHLLTANRISLCLKMH